MALFSDRHWTLGSHAYAAAIQESDSATESVEERLARRFAGAVVQEVRGDPIEPLFFDQGKPVIFVGQRILLAGHYRTSGQSIALVGREIVLAPETQIETAGLKGDPHFLPGNRAKDGATWSAHGADGSRGGRGGDGGDLVVLTNAIRGVIKLNLSGGDGGNGQAGGNGNNGANGANGRGEPRCENGGPGGPGGNAGAGGAGGAGGHAGIALIQSRQIIPPDQLEVIAKGGAGGAAGAHGSPGHGGAGGTGTADWFTPADIR